RNTSGRGHGAERDREVVERDRLAQDGTDPEGRAFLRIEVQVAADDERGHPVALASDQREERASGHARHLLVEQEHVEGTARAEALQGVLAVRGRFDHESLVGQPVAEDLAQEGVVLGDEHAHAQRAGPSPTRSYPICRRTKRDQARSKKNRGCSAVWVTTGSRMQHRVRQAANTRRMPWATSKTTFSST